MKRSRPPARLPSADSEWLTAIREAQETRADLAVSVAIDGIALMDSASVEDAAHEVTVHDGRAIKCSCLKFRIHKRPCAHRAFVAIRLWEDQSGADLSEVGAISLVGTLLNAYLTPPKRKYVRWWLDDSPQPEERYSLPEPVGEFV